MREIPTSLIQSPGYALREGVMLQIDVTVHRIEPAKEDGVPSFETELGVTLQIPPETGKKKTDTKIMVIRFKDRIPATKFTGDFKIPFATYFEDHETTDPMSRTIEHALANQIKHATFHFALRNTITLQFNCLDQLLESKLTGDPELFFRTRSAVAA